MRLPLIWRFFYIINVILFVMAAISLIALFYAQYDRDFRNAHEDLWPILGVSAGLLTMIFSYCLNIFMIHRYFPRKPISKKVRIANIIFFCLNIVIWLLLLVLFAVGFNEELIQPGDHKDPTGIYMLFAVGIVLIGKAFVLLMQIKLPSIIARGHRNDLEELIEAIGSHED